MADLEKVSQSEEMRMDSLKEGCLLILSYIFIHVSWHTSTFPECMDHIASLTYSTILEFTSLF